METRLSRPSQLKDQAYQILQSRCANADAHGYVTQWQDNLLPGISPDWCKTDLEQGHGNELKTKFRALHSSSALAINTFAPFKTRPGDLVLNEQSGFQQVNFEKKLSVFPKRIRNLDVCANLDVWLEADDKVIAVESKFTEFLSSKKPAFTDSYNRAALPQADSDWWKMLENAKLGQAQHLDVAQLVKHALGVLNYLQENSQKSATLLYLFWEPTDAAEYDVFCQHRCQLRDFQASVRSSKLRFEYMSYPELWCQWQSISALGEHTALLRQRYEFPLR